MSKLEDKLNIILLEKMLITKLMNQTIDLVHCTKAVNAIRKLIQAYDILNMNKIIIAKYHDKDKFCWDKAAVQDLSQISKELIVYHRTDFTPISKVYDYNENISNLISSLYANDKIINE